MKLKKLVGLQKKAIIKLAKSRAGIISKPVARFKRKSAKIIKLDVHIAFYLLHRLMQHQLRIRPRIRLIFVLIMLLGILYVSSKSAVAYIKPKEGAIKINGHAIVLAEAHPVATTKNVSEIEQGVYAKLSPFEFKNPVKNGILSQGFSAYHRANDIAAAYDSPIHPLGPGTVEFAGTMTDGKGNVVYIDHGNGLKTLYAHMDKIEAGVGNKVTADSIIGTIGLTGRTTGPHVHLEVYNNGVTIDPASVLPEN